MAEHNKEMRDLIASWEREIAHSEAQFQDSKQCFETLPREKSEVFTFHQKIVALRKKNDTLKWAMVEHENKIPLDLRQQYEVCKNRQGEVHQLIIALEDNARQVLVAITEMQRKRYVEQGSGAAASSLSSVAQSSAQPLRAVDGAPVENIAQSLYRGYISSQDENGYTAQLLGPLLPPNSPPASSIPFFQIPLAQHPVYIQINGHRDAISNIIEDNSKTPLEKYQGLCALIEPVTEMINQYQSTAHTVVKRELESLMDHLILQIDIFKSQSGVKQVFRQ